MLKTFQLIFFIHVLGLIAFSQEKNDWQRWRLRGKVHQVNVYNGYIHPKSDPKNSTIRSILAIHVFNRKGNLRVQFVFSSNEKHCSYKKTVYSYNQKDRKKSAAIYDSEDDVSLCKTAVPVFAQNQTENLGGSLSFVGETISEYDEKYRILKETFFDAAHKIVQEDNYEYNRQGQNTKYATTQLTNRSYGVSGLPVKTTDFRVSYRGKGKTIESYRYDDGKPSWKSISYEDQKKRSVGEESYKLEVDAQNNIIKEKLVFNGKHYYDGNKDVFSSTSYAENGDLVSQSYVLSENENELLRLHYEYRDKRKNTNQNAAEKISYYQFSDAEPELKQRLKYLIKFDQCVENHDWIPASFVNVFYKFDARGNTTTSTYGQRNRNDKVGMIYDREYIYYLRDKRQNRK